MDRLARNLDDLRRMVQILTKKGVAVEFLHEHLTFTGEDAPLATLLLSVMGAFAEFERALIRERQLEGIAAAKIRGVYRGRKPSIDPAEIHRLRLEEKLGATAIARRLGIGRASVYRALASRDGAPL